MLNRTVKWPEGAGHGVVMPHTQIGSLLQSSLETSTEVILKAHDVAIADLPVTEDGPQLCAVLGFTGPLLKGSLLVGVGRATLDALPHGGLPSEWLAELSNQLLGRVKHELLGWSVEIYLATPAVIAGERIRPLDGPSSAEHASWHYGGIWMWLEADPSPALNLDGGRAEVESLNLGDALLF
jgi:hypothetical protein